MMRFEYIHLKNFRQYRNEKIEFSDWAHDRNITVIQGAMGAGKTNILNAITWCFFGKENHLTGRSSKGLSMCNTAATNALQNGEECEVEVEIALLDDDDDNRIYVKRTMRFEKNYQGSILQMPYSVEGIKIDSLLHVDRVIDEQTIRESNPSAFIQRLIPEDIAPYFFFDGDNLNRYFEERSTTMSEAVETISQIDLLDLVIRHLEVAQNDMGRRVKNPTDEMKDLQKDLDLYEKKAKKNKEKVVDLKEEQGGMEDGIREIDDFLGSSAVGSAKEKSRQRKRLETEIIRKKGKLRDLERDRLSVCMDWGPIALTYPAHIQTVALVKEAEYSGKLPAAYKKNFLERMLKEGICICGCGLEEGSKHREEIEKLLLESDDLSNLSEDLADLSGRLRAEIEKFPRPFKRLVSLRRSIKQTQEEIGKAKEEQAKLEKELRNVDVDEVSRKEIERQSLRTQSLSLERRIGILENEIDRWKITTTDLKNRYTRAMSREKRFNDDAMNRKLCEDAIEYARKLRDDVISEIREEIEKLTKKYFLETHWKKGIYSDVTIDSNYSVSVKDNFGQEALGTLSRGETQVLAYAFVIALNIVSGFNFPLVIDTPLGRISSKPRIALANALSRSLEGKQLIFLMTDVEYTEAVKMAVHDFASSEYTIDFSLAKDAKGGEARLVKGNE